MTMLSDPAVAASLERIVFAGVALTTVAISSARPGFELTFPQWRVLVVLGDAPEGVRISDVATRVGVTLPATSRQLRRLERRGLLTVGRDERDRRAAIVRLTAEGQDARDAIVAYRRARIAEIAEPFEENAALRRELDRIADALSSRR
jgi:MarR family transcriptional regulator, organic hydroperoxide resistance regulator